MSMLLSWLSNPGVTTPYDLEEGLQTTATFNWYIVPLFVILFYLIWKNLRDGRYSIVLGGFAFWLWDVFNETWNAMVYATTGQPVWGTTMAGNSCYQILIGYNIEISIMFMILGMAACYMLKTTPGYEGKRFMDGNKNYLSDPNNMYYKCLTRNRDLSEKERKIKSKAVRNRIMTIVIGSISAVIIEIILNYCNVLTWEKPWWQPNFPFILFLIGYVPFFVCACLIHDAPRKWQLIGLGIELVIVIGLLVVAGSLGMLGHQIKVFPDGSWEWVGKWLKEGIQLIR